MVEGNRGHYLSVVPCLIKNLILGLRGIKRGKFGILGIYGNRSLKVSNFLHDGRGQ